MSYLDAREPMVETFLTNIDKVGCSVPCYYDNDPRPLPGEKGSNENPDLWVHFNFRVNATNQVGFGCIASARYRTRGNCIINVYGQLKKGDKPVGELADKIAGLYRSKHFTATTGKVKCQAPMIIPVGKSGKYWQVSVTCPYFIDEFSAIT